MPRGTRRTSYVRDNRGRFASTPGGGAPKRPPAKRASRGTNRLTRDNSGRITSVGGNGATARGGRLRTGAGNLRARQTDRLKGSPQGVLSRGGKVRGKVVAPTPRPVTRQRAKPPIGTPRKGQVARALARAEANMQRGSAAVDKAQGRNNRNISRASAEAGILQLSKPGSAEARKAKAAYDRLEKKIKKGEKTRTAAYNAEQRLGALKYAMTRGYGPTIAKAKVRAGGNRSLLEPAPGDRIKGGRQGGTIRNTTGQSKTLNKFNSRPVGTKVIGRGGKLVPSPTRVPLRVAGPDSKGSDRAFGRTVTKAARIRAASAGRKGKPPQPSRPDTAQANTFNETLKKANPAAYEKMQKREAKVAKAQQRKAAKLATRNGASAPSGDAGARARRSARLSGVSGRIAGRARRVYAEQGERVGVGSLPNRGLFAAPMGRRSTGTNAATSGLQPGRTIRGARVGGVARKGKAAPAKPAGKQKKPLTKERISAARGKIKAKLTAVLDEIRKVENAKNRDNTPASGGFSPRFLKLIARGQKADKQLESLGRASKRLKQIELSYDPAKYGYGRGTDQRKSLATEIRNARKQLTTLQREEATAKKAYEADPVVRFGLWGEIGQNRRQSRKAKERKSNAAMNRADRYIGAGIAVRQQRNAIKQLRDKAKRQTQETNKRQKPRNP